MSDQDHGDVGGSAQTPIDGVEQPSAEQHAPASSARRERLRQGPARMLQAEREQVELLAVDLDSVLAPDHQARLVWGYVQRQDWSELEQRIKARGSAAGRRAIDPRILFALWLYATLQGVGSGREIARLSRTHDAYRWICGGVGVNYHALNDFRADNERWFAELLSGNVAALAAIVSVITQFDGPMIAFDDVCVAIAEREHRRRFGDVRHRDQGSDVHRDHEHERRQR